MLGILIFDWVQEILNGNTILFYIFRYCFIIFFIMTNIFSMVFGLSVSRTISRRSCLQIQQALPLLALQ